MNNQYVPHFCYKCGACAHPSSHFCMSCGARLIKFPTPEKEPAEAKKSSAISQFFLALAKCFGYYSFFFATQVFVTVVAFFIVAIPAMGHYDAEGVEQLFYSYIHEIGIVSSVIAIVGYVIFFKIIKKSFVKETSLKPLSIGSSGAMVVFGFTFQIIIGILLALFYAIFFPDHNNTSNESVQMFFENGNVFIQILNVSILTGIVEEIVFRGLIHTTLKKVMPLPLAIFLSSVLFGAAHMNLEQFFYTTLLGALMALAYEKTGSLIAPILIHISFNGSNFVTEYLNFESDLPYFAIFFASVGAFLITAGMVFFTRKEPEKSLNIIKDK